MKVEVMADDCHIRTGLVDGSIKITLTVGEFNGELVKELVTWRNKNIKVSLDDAQN